MVENYCICKRTIETTEHSFYECKTVTQMFGNIIINKCCTVPEVDVDFWSFQNTRMGNPEI